MGRCPVGPVHADSRISSPVDTGSPVLQYRFLDVNLALSGAPALLDVMHSRLRYFPEADGHPDLQFEVNMLDDHRPHFATHPIGPVRQISTASDAGFQLEYFPARRQLCVRFEDEASALCDVERGHVRISVRCTMRDNRWLGTHPMFVIPLFELLKHRGHFNVHAAALSIDNKALLLAGDSGAGKSTLAVALCRAGFDFMSDDYVFIRRAGRDLTVAGFPEELHLLDRTAEMFPELRELLRVPRLPGSWKRQVCVEQYWGAQRVSVRAPGLLMFPSVAGTPASTLEPMSSQEALTELVPNIQCTEPTLAQTHLDLLGQLVRRSACYRLRTGQDWDVLPQRLRALVAAHRAA